MFPNWKRNTAAKSEPSPPEAKEASADKAGGGCCGGSAKSAGVKPAKDGAPQPTKKKGGCCG